MNMLASKSIGQNIYNIRYVDDNVLLADNIEDHLSLINSVATSMVSFSQGRRFSIEKFSLPYNKEN